MRLNDSLDPQRSIWVAPAALAAVVGALVLWRAVVGRDEPAPPPAIASASASATDSAAAPPSAAPPVTPRCVELGAEPFLIGEPSAHKAPRLAPASPDDPPEEPEEDLAPFAVEIGRGAVFDGGFAAGARRDAEGGAIGMVATLGLDGRGGKLVRLGRLRGDLDPPVVAAAGPAVLAAMVEPNASGRSIKIAKVVGDVVSWGFELQEGRDESLAIDLAASGPRAVVVWDDTPAGDKRSRVLLASFDVATMRSVTTARPISRPEVDAEAPRLTPRPGGYWLGYLVHGQDDAAKKAAGKRARAEDGLPREPGRKKDDGDDESGERIEAAWVELLPLDENGAPSGAARAVTPKSGHALAFDLELGDDGGALIAWRDDDTPQGSSGGRLSVALVRLGGAIEARLLAEESFGAGVPDLLPGWIAVGGSGPTRLAALDLKGIAAGPLDPEPSLGAGEPIAATKDAILIARPAGKAMRLSVVRCAPGR